MKNHKIKKKKVYDIIIILTNSYATKLTEFGPNIQNITNTKCNKY